jgi:hypothetical protein
VRLLHPDSTGELKNYNKFDPIVDHVSCPRSRSWKITVLQRQDWLEASCWISIKGEEKPRIEEKPKIEDKQSRNTEQKNKTQKREGKVKEQDR